MIGCFNYPITLSDYNYTEWLVRYKAGDAPITFEEIVMLMINWVSERTWLDILLGTSAANVGA